MIRMLAKLVSIVGFLYFVGYAVFADQFTYSLMAGILVAGVFFTASYEMVKTVDVVSNYWD